MKHLFLKWSLVAFTVFFFACETPKKQEESTKEEKVIKKPDTPFEKSLVFHGGLDTWNSFGMLKFQRPSANGVTSHTIDLKNRNEKIENPDNSILGFASDGYWLSGDKETQEKIEGMRFYKNLMFYFFGLPFVTADPGVKHETIADGVLNGKTYNRVKITFGENVGDAPDDQYILWLDKETSRIELINYSVTFGSGKKNSEKYNAIVFNEWQSVNGLTVPKKMTGHVWAADTLGKIRGQYEFENVIFSSERPSDSLFDQPEGAAFLAY